MSDIFCVTNRKLCKGNFLTQMEAIARCAPAGIVLREKDLPEEEYAVLAKKILHICENWQVPCILHSFFKTAETLQVRRLHMPLSGLRAMTEQERKGFEMLGTSVHSVEEAKEAQELGCSYLFAGHIFATDCKKDLPPRGLAFLQEVCLQVQIPVYAIGGINDSNFPLVKQAGAKGACVMSGLMQCEHPENYMEALRRGGESYGI